MYRRKVLDRIAPRSGFRRLAATLTAGQIAPEFGSLLVGAADEAIDDLAANASLALFLTSAKPTSDLLGRVAFGEAIGNEGAKPLIVFQNGWPLPTAKI